MLYYLLIYTKVSFFWDLSQDRGSSSFPPKKPSPLIGRLDRSANQRPGFFFAANHLNSCHDYDLKKTCLSLFFKFFTSYEIWFPILVYNNFIREISFISETKIGRIEHYVWGRRVTSYPRIVSLEVECLCLMIYLSKFMISDGLLFRGPDLNFDWFAP